MRYVYYVSKNTNVIDDIAVDDSRGVRPVLYLSSNITLTGTGTDSSNAFTIS